MHDVIYAARALSTTDAVADALMTYAAHLVAHGRVNTVQIPVVHDRSPATCRLVVGAGFPLAVVSVDGSEADLPGAFEAMMELSRLSGANKSATT